MKGVRSRPPRALLLEREEALREVLAEVLRDLGFEVLASEGRKQALALLLEYPGVDLAVVDLVDEPAGGEALVALLGELPPTASLPLIVMTDGEHATAPTRAIQLAKPFGLEELVSAVRSSFGGAEQPSGRRDADPPHDAR